MVELDGKKCTGCGLCVKACQFGAIKKETKLPEILESCVLCGECVKACKFDALTIKEKQTASVDTSGYKDIWVVAEMDPKLGEAKKVSFELLAEARKLADKLNQRTIAVLLCGRMPDRFSEQAADVGCDEIIAVEDKVFEHYDTEIFTSILTEMISGRKPGSVLFPATENGRDLAPRISGRLKVGLTADCTGLDIDADKNLLQIRPTFGGNIIASIISPNHRPQMASVRPNVFQVEQSGRTKPRVTKIPIGTYKVHPGFRFIRSEEKTNAFEDVTDKSIVIAGGYGLGSKENFEILKKVADRMNAALGATRKAVDEGWAPFEIQVGQTGKTIAPDVYIAFGISGALQHTIALKNAKTVIAVNNDPTAPIFRVSDVAILGDAIDVACNLNRIFEKSGIGGLEKAAQ